MSHLDGMAQWRRHQIQRLVRHDKRIGDQARLFIDQVRVSHPRQHLHGKDLLEGVLEFQKGNRPSRCEVHCPDAAAPFGQPLGQRDAAEYRRFADLRQADERQVAEEVQSPREARHLGR